MDGPGHLHFPTMKSSGIRLWASRLLFQPRNLCSLSYNPDVYLFPAGGGRASGRCEYQTDGRPSDVRTTATVFIIRICQLLRTLCLINSTIASVLVPGPKISEIPASFSVGMSSLGMIPPPTTRTSSMRFCRSSCTTRGKK